MRAFVPQTTEYNCYKSPKKQKNYSRNHIKMLNIIYFILESMKFEKDVVILHPK